MCGEAIKRADGKTDTVFREVATPEGLDNVMLSDGFVEHVARLDKGKREQFIDAVLPALQNPAEVWLQPQLIRGKLHYRRAFVAAFDDAGGSSTQGGRGALVVAQEDPFGLLAWTFVPIARARKLNDQRRGYLLYRRESASGG